MTTQSLSSPQTYEWILLIKTNRAKYLGAILASLLFIGLTLFLPTPWQVATALLGLSLLLYVALRPLVAYLTYDQGPPKEFDILAEMGNLEQADCVVEITCGLNRGTLGMHPHFKGHQYYVFNIFDEKKTPNSALRQAIDLEEPLPKLECVFPRKAAPGRLPLPDGFAQVVYANFTLHELVQAQDRNNILVEIDRILHPTQGRLLVAEHKRSVLNFFLVGMRSLQFFPTSLWLNHFAEVNFHVEVHCLWRGMVNLWCLKRGS